MIKLISVTLAVALSAPVALAGPVQKLERIDNRLDRLERKGVIKQGSPLDRYEDRLDRFEDRVDRREDFRDRVDIIKCASGQLRCAVKAEPAKP